MYSEEFENLLKEYLTDGIITTKERQVLLKKAQQLGYDVDEVDLYIDAQQQKCDQAVEAAAAKKRGKVCPRCGASLQSMQLTCPECGFEFNNAEANASAKDLVKKLEQTTDTERKTEIIANYPIPNTKENLTEFLTLCISNSTLTWNVRFSNNDYKYCIAWRKKSRQVIAKSRLMLKDDPYLQKLTDQLEKEISKKEFGGSGFLIGFYFVCILGLFGVMGIVEECRKSKNTNEIRTLQKESSELKTESDSLQFYSNYVNDLLNSGDTNDAKDLLVALIPNIGNINKYEPMFLNVINAYMNKNDYKSAESLATLLKSKYDDYDWKRTSIYQTLKSKFKAEGKDFSALKSSWDSSED